MITKNNLKSMLNAIGFSKFTNDKFEKYYRTDDDRLAFENNVCKIA
ncbi:hypothetical protein [Holdemanella biformis]